MVVDLFDDSYRSLFKTVQSCNHCLHNLFAAKTEHTHNKGLRPRGHNFALPPLKSEFARYSFVNRSLFYTGIFPDMLKYAKVVPIYKADDK